VEHLAKRAIAERSTPTIETGHERPKGTGRPGINLFGYHRSPIGLGSMTRGLSAAFREAGFPVAANTVGNIAMDRDLYPGDFVRRWDPAFDTNVFVSYPHLHEMLLHSQPAHRVNGRRNIAYLAWEQRDAHPAWANVYRDFDQVWALSSFAAESLSKALGRTVLPVPCALDLESLPKAGTRDDFDLPEERFVFLYIFDANSSVERKNPEGAIRAFARAFKPTERVTLLLRASNATRLEHRERLARLLATAPPTHDIRLLTGPLSRRHLMGLISAADCYVSLHRSEGFGYTCAEAMAYRRPVIATGYSGNLDFMDHDNSYLVRSREVEVEVPDGPFQRGSLWAEPDEEHAALLMRHVWQNPEEARLVGERARTAVADRLSVSTVAKVVAGALDGVKAPKQSRPRVSDLAASSRAGS
jgi:glycosyltransferase involved in cell wall biosynthesis